MLMVAILKRYNIQHNGIIKPVVTLVKSATIPKNSGIIAPPIIAVTIKPEISLDFSGR